MFRLLRYFSITSFIATLIGASFLGIFYHYLAVKDLVRLKESENVALTQAFANSSGPEFAPFFTSVSGLNSEELRAHPEVGKLRRAIRARMKGLPVVKVKVYNLAGLTVFSTEARQIGEDKSTKAGFLSARSGKAASELVYRGSFSAFEQTIEDRHIISSYIPIRSSSLDPEVKVKSHEVSLADFLAYIKSNYEVPLGKEIALNWDYPSDLPVVHTDIEKLAHILQNLINNAIKFTDRGSVTISAGIKKGSGLLPQASGTVAVLKVADTGIGITEESIPLIFGRFRQIDSSETRRHGGVGIGLYIVKKYTELLGGKIEVESQVGNGSTFTVTVPCASYESAIRSREGGRPEGSLQ